MRLTEHAESVNTMLATLPPQAKLSRYSQTWESDGVITRSPWLVVLRRTYAVGEGAGERVQGWLPPHFPAGWPVPWIQRRPLKSGTQVHFDGYGHGLLSVAWGAVPYPGRANTGHRLPMWIKASMCSVT